MILHDFTLNEVVRCRTVSKSFKKFIDTYLSGITYITYEDGMKIPFYDVDDHYTLKSYFTDKLKVVYTKLHSPKHLFPFLGKYCPNLRVFKCTSQDKYTYKDILHVASSIEYIVLKYLEVAPSHLINSPDILFRPFEKLQALNIINEFHSSDNSEKYWDYLFVKYLINQNKQILLTKHLVYTNWKPSIIPSNFFKYIRSLHLNSRDNILVWFPSSLAESLVDLSFRTRYIEPVRFITSCDIKFSSLEFLYFSWDMPSRFTIDFLSFLVGNYEPLFQSVFLTSKSLKYFFYFGPTNILFLKNIVMYLNSLNDLQEVFLRSTTYAMHSFPHEGDYSHKFTRNFKEKFFIDE